MPASKRTTDDGLGSGGPGNPYARGTAAWIGWRDYPEFRRGTDTAADQGQPEASADTVNASIAPLATAPVRRPRAKRAR